jgi:heat shock protein HslJ
MALSRYALFAPVALILLGCPDASAQEAKDKAPAPPPAASWVLERGRDIPARLKRRPQLNMEGAKLSGSTGCNSFTAALVDKAGKGDKAGTADKHIAIEQVALTRKMCAPAQDRVELAFVRALGETRYLEHKGQRLTFLSDKRQALLVFTSGKSGAVRPAHGRRHAGRARSHRRHLRVRHNWRRAPYAQRGCGGWRLGGPVRRLPRPGLWGY